MTDDELKRMFDTLRQDNVAAHDETRRHFGIVAEGLRHDVQLALEGVTATGERVVRLASEMKEEFAEVRIDDSILLRGARSPRHDT